MLKAGLKGDLWAYYRGLVLYRTTLVAILILVKPRGRRQLIVADRSCDMGALGASAAILRGHRDDTSCGLLDTSADLLVMFIIKTTFISRRETYVIWLAAAMGNLDVVRVHIVPTLRCTCVC
jgi:hypothetical protein